MKLSPIVLFAYNRPIHLRKTIEALKRNYLSEESELYIFSDAPKSSKQAKDVTSVRFYINNISGFKKTNIIERESNLGLANNIIDGVTSIIDKHRQAIVLEDDLITSPFFLSYMNNALNYFRDEKKVMHISGWNYPIDSRGLPESFLWRLMNCWGWATWYDRWQYFCREPAYFFTAMTKDDIYRLNLEGTYDYWSQLVYNKKGKIDTWAIFWYLSIFIKDGLCLNPSRSLVMNIGLDETGVHCYSKIYPGQILERQDIKDFPKKLIENKIAVKAVKKYLIDNKLSIGMKAYRELRKYIKKITFG